ncbi:hypothetical protein CALVIDRAFT_529358 [Calocera viscosa TUFC12733]|uniref:Uncharacterized protein n=1 Tax=Calocera viscosa (strain TUFC12733) TaxID=1330018 RepID=A0A167JIF1_CALVF|nr:hypothetical protein CALVIDRAFT_529358 [Calocera viscosa TUFC12733]
MPAELRLPRRPASLDLWYPPYPSSSTPLGTVPEPLRVRFPAPLPYLFQRSGRAGEGPGDVDTPADPATAGEEGAAEDGMREERNRERRDIEAHLSVLRAAHRIPLRPAGHFPTSSAQHMRSLSLPHPRTPPNRPRTALSEDEEDEAEGGGEEAEGEEDELLFRASLLTGSNARLRRRGAIRLSLPSFDAPLPLSPDSPTADTQLILCGRGWAAGARLPSGGRAPPDPVGGCGGLVHKRARREEGVYVSGAREEPEALVGSMRRRKRLGCGCEVELLGCRACGTPLGTHTTHLCKLHSLRHSPSYKARYRFLPSRVFPATAALLPPYSASSTLAAEEDASEELSGFLTPPASPGPGESVLVFDPNGDPEAYPTLSPERASCTPSPVPPSPSPPPRARPTLPPLSPVPALSLSPLGVSPATPVARPDEAHRWGSEPAVPESVQQDRDRLRRQIRGLEEVLAFSRTGPDPPETGLTPTAGWAPTTSMRILSSSPSPRIREDWIQDQNRARAQRAQAQDAERRGYWARAQPGLGLAQLRRELAERYEAEAWGLEEGRGGPPEGREDEGGGRQRQEDARGPEGADADPDAERRARGQRTLEEMWRAWGPGEGM